MWSPSESVSVYCRVMMSVGLTSERRRKVGGYVDQGLVGTREYFAGTLTQMPAGWRVAAVRRKPATYMPRGDGMLLSLIQFSRSH